MTSTQTMPWSSPATGKHDAGAGNDPDQRVPQLFNALLQRRLFLLCPSDSFGDAADFGLHADGGDNSHGPAMADRGPHKDHVLAVVNGRVHSHGVGDFLHWHGFAREGRLTDPDVGDFQKSPVGGNAVAGFKNQDVTGHESGGIHQNRVAVAADLGLGCAEIEQCRHGLPGLHLLREPDDGHEQQDGADHGSVRCSLEIGLYARGPDQHIHQRIGKLLEEEHIPRLYILCSEHVLPEIHQALPDGFGGQTIGTPSRGSERLVWREGPGILYGLHYDYLLISFHATRRA